jgi:hypothetical protein
VLSFRDSTARLETHHKPVYETYCGNDEYIRQMAAAPVFSTDVLGCKSVNGTASGHIDSAEKQQYQRLQLVWALFPMATPRPEMSARSRSKSF